MMSNSGFDLKFFNNKQRLNEFMQTPSVEKCPWTINFKILELFLIQELLDALH